MGAREHKRDGSLRVTRWSPRRLATILLVASTIAACEADRRSLVVVELGLDPEPVGDMQGPVRDADGLAVLDEVGVFVVATLENPTSGETAYAEFPLSFEDLQQEATLQLEITGGEDLPLTITAYQKEGDRCVPYVSSATTVDVTAGQENSMEVLLSEGPMANVKGEVVRCAGCPKPQQVDLIDVGLNLVLGSQPVAAEGSDYTFSGAPAERPLRLRVLLSGGDAQLFPSADASLWLEENEDRTLPLELQE